MPIMDGMQATSEIRKLEQNRPSPAHIIALTAYSTDGFKTKCHEAGMDDFLTKPISAEQLESVIHHLET